MNKFIIIILILILTLHSFNIGYKVGIEENQRSIIFGVQKIETPKAEIPKIEYEPSRYREATAYTLSRDETDNDPCMTASGVNACESDLPIVATNELPFWVWVEIDGKEYVVLDRMNSRFKTRYDILMKTKGEAIQFGIQKVIVKVIK